MKSNSVKGRNWGQEFGIGQIVCLQTLNTLCCPAESIKNKCQDPNLWSDLPSKTAALSTSFHLDWSDDERSCDCEANVQQQQQIYKLDMAGIRRQHVDLFPFKVQIRLKCPKCACMCCFSGVRRYQVKEPEDGAEVRLTHSSMSTKCQSNSDVLSSTPPVLISPRPRPSPRPSPSPGVRERGNEGVKCGLSECGDSWCVKSGAVGMRL